MVWNSQFVAHKISYLLDINNLKSKHTPSRHFCVWNFNRIYESQIDGHWIFEVAIRWLFWNYTLQASDLPKSYSKSYKLTWKQARLKSNFSMFSICNMWRKKIWFLKEIAKNTWCKSIKFAKNIRVYQQTSFEPYNRSPFFIQQTVLFCFLHANEPIIQTSNLNLQSLAI